MSNLVTETDEATDYEFLARQLEGSNDYRVLHRLKELVPVDADPMVHKHRGVYVDCESTGLDTRTDEVIELCCFPFEFTSDGLITGFGEPLRWLNEPKKRIDESITKLTGITADAVRGNKIDEVRLNALLTTTDLVVAHNASYDRQMLERVNGLFKNRPWACSQTEAPWKDYGMSGSRLSYLMMEMGLFHDAHGALPDCMAGLRALQHVFANGRTALSYLLECARTVSHHIWAIDAPYESKDLLKARGYFWNPGEDGRPKAWHKELRGEGALADEQQWLRDVAYGENYRYARCRFDRITAYDRFSVRG